MTSFIEFPKNKINEKSYDPRGNHRQKEKHYEIFNENFL